MIKQKHHLLVIGAIMMLVSAISLINVINILAQTTDGSSGGDNTTTDCAGTCGEWSACQTSGIKMRNCSAPTSCSRTQWSETQSCTYSYPCASYTYKNLGLCQPNNTQTREIDTKTPTGCYISSTGPQPQLTLSCNYTAPAGDTTTQTPVCVFSYSDWGTCTSAGYQSRTETARSPSGCAGTPELKRSCGYVPPTTTSTITTTGTTTYACSYDYTAWGECQSNGIQKRAVRSYYPYNCNGSPLLEQNCNYASGATTAAIACNYTYGAWGPCETSGKQYRPVMTVSPNNCYGVPKNFQPCAYAAPTTDNGMTATTDVSAAVCEFTYSDWYPCQSNNKQNRTVTAAAPAGCSGGIPLVNQACAFDGSVSSTNTAALPANYNDLTMPDWQKKYFGAAYCLAEKMNICAGQADPDKDNLSNNDEYRYGTNPLNPDSDGDGKNDGDEIRKNSNPVVAATSQDADNDSIAFESPKEAGVVQNDILGIQTVQMAAAENDRKDLQLTGKGLPNSFVNIYIYSDDPLILTVKTDDEGNWSYTLDKELADGNHEVYVAVTDNTGKITAKSDPIAFVKTAEAASILPPAEAASVEKAMPPTESRKGKDIIFLLALIFSSMGIAIVVIISYINHHRKEKEVKPV